MGVCDMKKSHTISSSDRNFHFPEGSLVEVRTNEKGLKDVYFSATVLPQRSSAPTSSRKISRKLLYVEYHNLVTKKNGSKKLRLAIDVKFVRPTPPELHEEDESARAFQPDDIVDAFYNDGWWIGVVSRVVKGGERVEVTFQNPPDVREFRASDVRPHWDWRKGIWAKKQNIGFRESMFGVGKTVEISVDERSNGDGWVPAIVHRRLENGDLWVEYDLGNDVIAKVDIEKARPCPLVPVKDERNFSLFEQVDAYVDHVWWRGVIKNEVENSGYVVFLKKSKEDKEFSRWDLRPHMEWKDGKWLLSSFPDDMETPAVTKKRRSALAKIKRIPAWPRMDQAKCLANSGLVERACKLRLNDPKGMIDEIMAEVAVIEENGFDVGVVQEKLSKLVDLKVELEKLEDEASKLRSHVSEHSLAKDRIEEERRELLEKLSFVESAKQKEESKIASLQAALKVIEENIKIVGCDFEGTVSSI